MKDFLDEQLSFNAALPRTLWVLMARPGRLTREWMSGRRTRYLPPIRLLLLALAALLAVAFTVHVRPSSFLPDDLLHDFSLSWEEGRQQAARYPTYLGPEPGAFQAVERRTPVDVAAADGARRWATTGILLLVPLLALTLRVLYRRRVPYLVDHIVFSAHMAANVLLLSTVVWIALGVDATRPDGMRLGESALFASALWLLVYLHRALSVVYGEPWWRTTAKTLVIAGLVPVFGLLTWLAPSFLPGTSPAIAQSRRAFEYVRHADSLWVQGDTTAFQRFGPSVVAELHRVPYGVADLHHRIHLAETELRLGRTTSARQTAEDALVTDPDDLLLLALATAAAAAEGRRELAAEYEARFREVRDAFPGDPVEEMGHASILDAVAPSPAPTDVAWPPTRR
jgi:hypothetical protein